MKCKATSKQSGRQCRNECSDGFEVCWIHGGSSPVGMESASFKHGRYSKHLPRQIASKLAMDDDPLDLLPELNVQRGLFTEYISRFHEGVTLSAGDIQMLMQWASDITKTVERIVKIRNETALTKAEITYLAARVSDVVSKYITDETQQAAFIRDLFSGFVPAGTGELNAEN